MRLWHIDLIPYLPKSQLLAQWRELNLIFKKQPRHILINYIYNYDQTPLIWYVMNVASEMLSRGYKCNMGNFCAYLYFLKPKFEKLTGVYFLEHNKEYLTICYWNLREKYLRGQKDFTKEVWDKLDAFYKSQI